jgi:hypothetical protein
MTDKREEFESYLANIAFVRALPEMKFTGNPQIVKCNYCGISGDFERTAYKAEIPIPDAEPIRVYGCSLECVNAYIKSPIANLYMVDLMTAIYDYGNIDVEAMRRSQAAAIEGLFSATGFFQFAFERFGHNSPELRQALAPIIQRVFDFLNAGPFIPMPPIILEEQKTCQDSAMFRAPEEGEKGSVH